MYTYLVTTKLDYFGYKRAKVVGFEFGKSNKGNKTIALIVEFEHAFQKKSEILQKYPIETLVTKVSKHLSVGAYEKIKGYIGMTVQDLYLKIKDIDLLAEENNHLSWLAQIPSIPAGIWTCKAKYLETEEFLDFEIGDFFKNIEGEDYYYKGKCE